MSRPVSKHNRWREITDLPNDVDPLRDRELESLFEVWVEERRRIGDDLRVGDFNARLAREWAIETGIIEDLYTLDRGITQTLIERGVDSSYIPHDATNRDPELVARIIHSHGEVLEGLFSFIKGERPLTTGYIKEIHAALLRHQNTVKVFDAQGQMFEVPLEKGIYKRMPNNPMRPDGTLHEYCPPEHTASEMDRMIQIYDGHLKRNILPHVEAAWLHHAFTQIHPFQDGNGRVARSLATLVFIKGGFFPLVVNRDDRNHYIDALESADAGDISQLTRLFAQLQKRSLTKAIGSAVDIRPVGTVDEALTVTRDLLVNLGKFIPAEFLVAQAHAEALFNITIAEFNKITERLTREVSRVESAFRFSAGTLADKPLREVRELAEKLKYDPNLNDFCRSVTITFVAATVSSRIVISFHGVGTAFRGLLVAAGYFQVADGPAVPVSEDVFRISYHEAQQNLISRFQPWLDSCIIEGIAQWRRTLI